MAKARGTKLITETSQVPEGFVRLYKLTRNKSEQNYLSHLHRAGQIPSVKMMKSTGHRTGGVWVDSATALRLLKEQRDFLLSVGESVAEVPSVRAQTVIRADAAPSIPVVVDHGPTLARIATALERLAEVAEEMWVKSEDAKQRELPHHTVGH